MDEQQPHTPPAAEVPPPPNYYAQPTPVAQPVQAQEGPITDTVAAVLAYLLAIPVAIVFLLVEPYNKRLFVRFHSLQALGLVIAMFALQFLHIIPILGTIVALLGALVIFVFWIIAFVKALQGEMYEVPLIGKVAMEQALKPA